MLEIRILFCLLLPSIILAVDTANSTDSNIKPKMHQNSDNIAAAGHNDENTIPDDNNKLMSYNATFQRGETAVLTCNVPPEYNKIYWVRGHVLSWGNFTFTSDQRLYPIHAPSQSTYTLRIKYVQKRDEGVYECQVVTSKGVMTLWQYASLQVLIPEAVILGGSELHVDKGSALNLVCVIEKSPTPPRYVYWYRNDRWINYDDSSRDITIETTSGPRTQSRLTILEPKISDSGNYTCSASNSEPASIYVFVSEGNETAVTTRSVL